MIGAMSLHEQYSDIPRGQVIATYDTYVEAQRAVDFLADEQFAVENVSIVGSDLKMVERVTGRLTRGRAAAAGAASGAWFGLFVGVLLSLFAESGTNGFALVVAALIYGAIFGTIFGFVGHALSGGKRDFTSRSKIVSSRYEIVVVWAHADKAREVLSKLQPSA
jgi:heat induced stress protein YflT